MILKIALPTPYLLEFEEPTSWYCYDMILFLKKLLNGHGRRNIITHILGLKRHLWIAGHTNMKQLTLILLTDNKQGIVLCVAHSKRRRVSGALWPSILAEICELQESETLFQNPIWTAPEKTTPEVHLRSPHARAHTQPVTYWYN